MIKKNNINDKVDAKPIIINAANIKFENLNFAYDVEEGKTLSNINIEFIGGKMTSLLDTVAQENQLY